MKRYLILLMNLRLVKIVLLYAHTLKLQKDLKMNLNCFIKLKFQIKRKLLYMKIYELYYLKCLYYMLIK